MSRIPLFPLDVVLFPGEIFALHVFEERYLLMTEELLHERSPFGVVLARQDEPEDVIEHEPMPVGTAARIVKHEKLDDGHYLLHVVGGERFRIRRVHHDKLYQEADVRWLPEPEGDADRAHELATVLLRRFEEAGADVDWSSGAVNDPVAVSHAVAAALPVDLTEKQRLLEETTAEERLGAATDLLQLV